jgi:hypothetical protein
VGGECDDSIHIRGGDVSSVVGTVMSIAFALGDSGGSGSKNRRERGREEYVCSR